MSIVNLRNPITIQTLSSIVVAVIVGLLSFFLSALIEKIFLSIILAITTFVLCQSIFIQKSERAGVNQCKNHHLWIIELLAICSLLLLLLTPSLATHLLIEEFQLLPIMIVRSCAALFLTFFFPGYILISILHRINKLTPLERVALSYPISLVVMIVIGIIGIIGFSFLLSITTIYFLIIGIFIIIGVYLIGSEKVELSSFRFVMRFNWSSLTLLGIIIFLISGTLISRSSMLRVVNLDIWRHLGVSLTLVNGDPSFWISPQGIVAYPWGSRLIIAVFVAVCGLPVINSIWALAILDIMPVVGFYLLVSTAFRKREKLAILSTSIWSLFQGLGWIIVAPLVAVQSFGFVEWFEILQHASLLTWQDIGRVTSLYNIFRDPFGPFLIGVFTVFLLTFLLLRQGLHPYLQIGLSCLLVFVGFLIHIVETLIFAGFLVLIALVAKLGAVKRVRYIGLGGLFGMGLVVIIDALTIFPNFVANFAFLPSILFFLLAEVICVIREQRSLSINQFSGITFQRWGKSRHRALLFIPYIVFVYCWGLALIVWPLGTNIIVSYFPHYQNSALLPWFAYPLRLGVAGILTLIAILIAIITQKGLGRSINLFLALSVTALVTGHVISYLNVLVGSIFYWEIRFLPLVFVGISIVAAWTLCEIAKWLRIKRQNGLLRISLKQIAVVGLFSLILCSGIASTILDIDYGRLLEQSADSLEDDRISGFELDALNFLRWNRVGTDVVATVSEDSRAYLQYYTGAYYHTTRIVPYETSILASSAFYQFRFPEPLTELGRVRQLYLARQDNDQLLQFNDNVLLELTSTLPIMYSNDEVMIYRLPPFYPESNIEGLQVVTRGELPLPISGAVSLSGLRYQLVREAENGLLRGSEILLPCDIHDFGWAEFNFTQIDSSNSGSGKTFFQSEEGVGILSISGAIAPTWFNGYLGMNTSLNTDEWRFLHLKVRTTSSSRWGVAIWDLDEGQWLPTSSDVGANFIFSHNAQNRWSEFTLDLKEIYGQVNFSRLLLGGYLDEGSNGSCEWDWCIVSQQPCIQVINSTRYLDWVASGGQLFILDTGGLGEFAQFLNITTTGNHVFTDRISFSAGAIDIPQLEVPIYTSIDGIVETVATFRNATGAETPYVFKKSWGEGIIRYIVMSPILEGLESSNNETRINIFDKLGQLLCAGVGITPPSDRDIIRFLPGSASKINLSGNVIFKSAAFATDLLGVDATRIRFEKGGLWYLNETATTGDDIGICRILSISLNGKSKVLVNSTEASMETSRYGGYSLIQCPSEGSVQWLLEEGNITLDVLVDSLRQKITIIKGRATLDFSSLSFLLRNPVAVTADGSVYLEWSKLSLADGRRFRGNATIVGSSSFVATVSAVDLHFENFTIDGQILIAKFPVGPSFEEWLLPWGEILLSPLHSVWVCVLVISLVIGYWLHRNKQIFDSHITGNNESSHDEK